MSANIDQWFIDIFESEVHQAFQREEAKLEMCVRVGGRGPGKRVWFPKLGKSNVVQKARHGQVPIQLRDEGGVWVNLEDWYTGDMVDSLDELKTNVAARGEYTQSQAYGLARKSDEMIVTALDAGTNVGATAGVLTLAKVNAGYTFLGNKAVPTDGRRYFVVSPKGWTDLMAITQFADADYVGQGELPFAGGAGTAKRWFSFYVFTQEGEDTDDGALPKTGNIRTGFMWHQRAIGYHRQKAPSIKMDWENMHQAYSIIGSMVAGSGLIDDNGVWKLGHDETATP